MSSTEFRSFASSVFGSLGDVFSWFIDNLFFTSVFNNYLVFFITGLIIIGIVIEELAGILTSLRFGGFFVRRFRAFHVDPISSDLSIEPISNNFFNRFSTRLRKDNYYIVYDGHVIDTYKHFLRNSHQQDYINKIKSAGMDVMSYDEIKSYKLNFVNSSSTSAYKGFTGSKVGFNVINDSMHISHNIRNQIEDHRSSQEDYITVTSDNAQPVSDDEFIDMPYSKYGHVDVDLANGKHDSRYYKDTADYMKNNHK